MLYAEAPMVCYYHQCACQTIHSLQAAEKRKGEKEMTNSEIGLLAGGILGILVGISVIVWPRILAYMVGIYLILVGIIAIVAAVR